MSEFKPEAISQDAWDAARHFLSVGFTVPIGDRLAEVIALATDIDNLTAYDFKMVTWNRFSEFEVLPVGIFARANSYKNFGNFDFVVYDPLDDANGFLLVGNDACELAKQACEYIANQEPEDGPLSPDNIVMTTVEGN